MTDSLPDDAAGSEAPKTRQAHWRLSNPTKYRAHLIVGRALSTGALKRGRCEVCGAAKVDAHHDHYDRPLEVRWLCRRHHTRLHCFGEDMFPMATAERS